MEEVEHSYMGTINRSTQQILKNISVSFTSIDRAFKHGQIGSSHTVEKIVSMTGCVMGPKSAHGFRALFVKREIGQTVH
jgi:hypothetical protein